MIRLKYAKNELRVAMRVRSAGLRGEREGSREVEIDKTDAGDAVWMMEHAQPHL